MQTIIRIAAAVCLLCPAGMAQMRYTNPQGRFRFAAPAGWRPEAAAAPPPRAARAADTIRLVRYSVRDPGVNNIEAVSFLIPAGWRTEGGIQWLPEYRILANLLLRISGPETGAAVEFLPLQYFFYWPAGMQFPRGSDYLGRVVWLPIRDAGEFVRTMYMGGPLSRLRNARTTARQDMPRLAELAAQEDPGSQASASRIRYEYAEQGQAWEEDVYVTLVYQFVAGIAIWRSDRAYSFRAPNGLLDRMTPLMAAVVSTAKLNLDWFAQHAFAGQLFDERMRQGIRGAAALSETIRRNSEEIRRMYEQSYPERSAAEDRIHRRFTEYIRGVETWRNPYEDRPVQLPSGYSNVWVNRSGEYILSNQAGFNPNVGSNIEWRLLERVR